jgi:hypothetical protein
MLRELPLVMFSQTADSEVQSGVWKSSSGGVSIARNFWRSAVLDVDFVYGK